MSEMKKGLSLLVFVMDRSGSMFNVIDETIDGFNNLIEEQRKLEGLSAKVTLAIFDNEYELIHDYVDINNVPKLTDKVFFARSWTSLLDAIGKTIQSVGNSLKDIPEEERPEKVLFTVFTDGAENSSKEYGRNKIKEMIEHQESKYSWKFNFVGANIDSFSEAGSLGISIKNTANYTATSKGTTDMMRGVSSFYSMSRTSDDNVAVMDLASYISIDDNV